MLLADFRIDGCCTLSEMETLAKGFSQQQPKRFVNDYFRNVLIPYMEREDRSDLGRRQPRSRSVSPDARSAEVSLSLVHLMSLLALQGEI